MTAPRARERLAAAARIALAVLLALPVSEVALRVRGNPHRHDFHGSCEVELGEPDDRLGWVWKGPYAQTVRQGGRPVRYVFDGHHDRVQSADAVEDPGRPTIVLVGESIVSGHGLAWAESLPALLEAATGDQVVDLGVDGYGPDQAFVRLVDALPRLPHVVAVVTIVFPALLTRLGWDERPRLSFDGDVPRVGPPSMDFWHDLRLARVVRETWPHLSPERVALGHEILRQTSRLARARGAKPVILTPTLRPAGEEPGVPDLVRDVMAGIDAEWVNPGFEVTTLPGDNHPDAASTKRLAEGVLAALGRP